MPYDSEKGTVVRCMTEFCLFLKGSEVTLKLIIELSRSWVVILPLESFLRIGEPPMSSNSITSSSTSASSSDSDTLNFNRLLDFVLSKLNFPFEDRKFFD